ncbi:MAG: efflux RND transporter periplasmic adaptor subunit [Bryobacteraceae bacterium]
MAKKLLLLLLIPVAAVVWWGLRVRNQPPEVPFAKVRRETLVSTLPTNGRVEPIAWSPVRSDGAGLVASVPVQHGQQVQTGATIAVLSSTGLQADVSAAEARVAQARADLDTVEAGGRAAELAEIQSGLARARFERDAAQREYEALQRLQQKQAATAVQVDEARDRMRQSELQIDALEKRRAALVGRNDRSTAEARLREAEAALAQARARIARTVIRAPLSGVVYKLEVRPGAYVEAGGPVAEIGQIDRLRVRVYVDEPELGRVAVGQPVTITWDALPGKKWTGTVEKKPSEIVALGTRQVGEVLCTISNPGQELIPGTNVNAEIRTNVAKDALTIPKEALRHQAGAVGAFVLRGDTLAWQEVTTGASSVTRVEVLGGLREGDAVALPTEAPLRPEMRVRAVFP